MKQQRYPTGWREERARKLLLHYETQTEDEAVAEDEAAFRRRDQTVMVVPKQLMPMTTILFTLFACTFLVGAVNAAELKKKLDHVEVSSVQAEVGIGVVDLSSGESWFLHGEQRFPMQSVVKVPVAIAILKLVDDGALSLGQSVTISPEQYAPSWSPLRDELKGGSGQFTVRRLLERDRKSTRLNSSHIQKSRMPSSA